MPFGAEIQEGGVSFRLWAPDAGKVTLCLEEGTGEREIVMDRREEGWHRCFAEKSGPGSRYLFQIDDTIRVPDPASRYQPDGVHGASMVIDPLSRSWQDTEWRGRPLEEAVFYELHVGAFSQAGTYVGVEQGLDYLADLGATVVELMPVAAFAGCRNWGYDGVLPFAPSACYGTPDELKSLVESAHERGLMVFLDVVYNHFGPEGNYLHHYASSFFTERFHTPWGAAIRFSGPGAGWVRRFFIENALYWLEEFHLDGLRLDAVHSIFDPSAPSFLEELAAQVRNGPGRERQVHLILENDNNQARLLRRSNQRKPVFYSAQWNDDVHHALHILLTGETDGYYIDYADRPMAHLARCLTEGFAYQGEKSVWRHGKKRGEKSTSLPPAAFVQFLQNHDQIGNRALGERLSVLTNDRALRAATAVLLLSPQLPLLFMGQEWCCRQPFLYFCDFGDDLAQKVRDGRRQEFAGFIGFADGTRLESLLDPCARETFEKCVLDWSLLEGVEQQQWLSLHRGLLAIRKRQITPRLDGRPISGRYDSPAKGVLLVEWRLADESALLLTANFAARAYSLKHPGGSFIYCSEGVISGRQLVLEPWSVAFLLRHEREGTGNISRTGGQPENGDTWTP